VNQSDIRRAFLTNDQTLLRQFVQEYPAVPAPVPESIISIVWKMGKLVFEEQGTWYCRGAATNELHGPFESEGAAVTALKQDYYQYTDIS